ncbi:cysteine desulfurase family protein [Brevibacillus laterosporus]|uniref:cysteine desulfurase family protein n=1 Tax=Brevibacillus laterosporus TaxID=1465 RepID=UPI0009F51173|nr:cysteine desulfurase family protein [Brevibacillus laterosporus]
MIYLDNSATTQPHPQVIDTMKRTMEAYYGNPSSLHRLGVEAENVLKQARQIAAHALQKKPTEIFFTSGGTESNNTAIKGVAMRYRERGRHIITSQIEHASVLDVCKQLEEFGYDVTYLPVNKEGRVSLEDVKQAMRPDTILVSIMHVNNELGTIQPINQIGTYLKLFPKVIFHVDAVQSFGKVPLRINEWGVDLLSLSAHKFHGPRGVGILVKRENMLIEPLLKGGGQESGLRSGTENIPGIAGMAKAMRLIEETATQDMSRLKEMQQRLREGIQQIPGCIINSPETEAAPHIINISVLGMKAEVLLHALEAEGFCVSTRSACSARSDEPSPVLVATGMSREQAKSSLRISLGKQNTMDDVEKFLVALQTCKNRILPYTKV